MSFIRLGLVGWAVFLSLPQTGLGNEAQIQQAIAAYASAMASEDPESRTLQFARAEQLFRQVIEGDANSPGTSNADLWTNLGNCALQAERIGHAIAAFRQALTLEPGNEKAAQNLSYARSLLPEWIRIENELSLVDSLFFWTEDVSLSRLSTIAAILFAAAVIMFCVGWIGQQSLIRNLAVIPALCWLVVLGGVIGKSLNEDTNNLIVIQEATLFSADSETSSPRISRPLPDGAEVETLQTRERWIEVRLPGNVSGWLLKSKSTEIMPSA